MQQTSQDAANSASPGPASASALPQVGTAPVNWNNDDLPGWRPVVPFPELITEMAATGYAGTEYGNRYPTDPTSLRGALAVHNLELCGCYQWLPFINGDAISAGKAALERKMRLLMFAACEHLVVATEFSPDRVQLAGHVPVDGSAGLDDNQWDTLRANLVRVAEAAARFGLHVHYHNHVGTYVETPTEVERLMKLLPGTGVDLCFDTGHYAYGGGDPIAFIEEYGDLIGYLHLKDVDPEVLAKARAEGASFHDALRQYVFAEFGQGMLDIPRLIEGLRGRDYHGWIVVEQDTSRRPSSVTAKANRDYLREHCGL